MEISDYYGLKDIFGWFEKYEPNGFESIGTHLIFTASKIVDIANTICRARSCIYFTENKDYGDFARDENTKKFVNALLIENALGYYNYSVDYLWQAVWLAYSPEISQEKLTTELLENILRTCDYENLILQLTLKPDIKMVKLLDDFFKKDEHYLKVRPQYNYMKHRGCFHVKGLGINDSVKFPIMINGQSVEGFKRKELDAVQMKEDLLNFDKSFIDFCEIIAELIVPEDYSNKISLNAVFNKIIDCVAF